jgi:hypothetical protein
MFITAHGASTSEVPGSTLNRGDGPAITRTRSHSKKKGIHDFILARYKIYTKSDTFFLSEEVHWIVFSLFCGCSGSKHNVDEKNSGPIFCKSSASVLLMNFGRRKKRDISFRGPDPVRPVHFWVENSVV